MKRFLLSFSLLLVAFWSQADNVFTIEDTEIKRGEEMVISVSLTNDEVAKSAAIDITLPEGLSFVNGTNDGSVVFSDRVSGITSKTSKIQSSGALRIGMAFGSIAAGSGELFTFKVKASETADVGSVNIRYSAMSLTLETSGKTIVPGFSSKVTVYALYDVNVQTNGYMGGSVSVTKGAMGATVKSGTEIELTATASEGYHFVKWSDDVTNNPYSFILTTDTVLSAVFAPNQYTMTFKPENGQGDIIKTQDYNSELTAPTGLIKEGYTFMGWSPEVPTYVPSGDRTFIAQWQGTLYTMTFKLENGEADIVKMQGYNTTLEKPADPQRDGYTFMGWDTEVPAFVPASDKTFTAQWQINSYKVKFVVDEVTVKEETLEYGAAIVKPADPRKDNFIFAGWIPVVPEMMPAGDQTFTAQWETVKYTITFVLDNGEADIVMRLEAGADLETPTPKKTGYTFTGWDSEVPSTVPASDKTYKALWQINKYKLIYMVDGEEYKSYELEYGAEITPEAIPVKEGYTFSGWNMIPATMPAGDYVIQGTFTEDKVIVNNITYEINGDNAIASGGVHENGDLTLPETITSNGVTYQVTGIGKEAFKGNISLTSVNIPNTITTIDDGAFDGCINVKIIYIGSAVRNIGSKAFANINSTDSREISTTADARSNSKSLTVVSYARNVPVTAPDAFENTDIESAGLMVDYRSLNDYSSVNPWRNFGSIIPYNRPTDVGSVKAEQGVSDSYFNLDGSRLSKPQRGIVIVREADGSVRKVSVK